MGRVELFSPVALAPPPKPATLLFPDRLQFPQFACFFLSSLISILFADPPANCGQSGNWTHTSLAGLRILSPVRLPVPPSALHSVNSEQLSVISKDRTLTTNTEEHPTKLGSGVYPSLKIDLLYNIFFEPVKFIKLSWLTKSIYIKRSGAENSAPDPISPNIRKSSEVFFLGLCGREKGFRTVSKVFQSLVGQFLR